MLQLLSLCAFLLSCHSTSFFQLISSNKYWRHLRNEQLVNEIYLCRILPCYRRFSAELLALSLFSQAFDLDDHHAVLC